MLFGAVMPKHAACHFGSLNHAGQQMSYERIRVVIESRVYGVVVMDMSQWLR